ncbi:MAG: toxin-antitoxin system YwqK family antitoxin [Bacteroidales bacterium]|nr:toxin-antitoxin system YwqK family antitoxin [Bacteroidales bacterium]
MRFIYLIIFTLFFASLNAQNVGQPGNDSIINYTDIQGNKQGKWMKKYDKDRIAYIGYFKDNKLVGTYKRWYYSGALKTEIKYNSDGSVGYAKHYWDNGKMMAKGKYINQNVKDSTWEYYGIDGALMMKETFANGILHGLSLSYYRNGQVSRKVPYNNGKIHGIYKEYFENGITRIEIYYENGVRKGPIKVYYDDAKIYLDGYYVNDLPHGKWTVYFKDGSIEKELEYINGKLKNEDEVDREFAKKVLEWDKMKGKIPEPKEEDFFDPKFKPRND